MFQYVLYCRYANAKVHTNNERAVDYALPPQHNPLKSEQCTSNEDEFRDRGSHPNPIIRQNVPSNYGEFVNESLAAISSTTTGSQQHSFAKEELNLLAKLVGCTEQEKDNSDSTHKKFKLNLFETAGINTNTTSNVDT